MPILEDDELAENELNNNAFNKRIHFWNRIYRGSIVLLLLVTIGIVGSVATKVDKTTQAIKKQQEQTEQATAQARKDNIARQDALTGYVKCISLLRFDDPSLLSANVTRQQVADALDKCAKAN